MEPEPQHPTGDQPLYPEEPDPERLWWTENDVHQDSQAAGSEENPQTPTPLNPDQEAPQDEAEPNTQTVTFLDNTDILEGGLGAADTGSWQEQEGKREAAKADVQKSGTVPRARSPPCVTGKGQCAGICHSLSPKSHWEISILQASSYSRGPGN